MRTLSLALTATLLALPLGAHAQPLFSNAAPDPSTPALGATTHTLSGVVAPAASFWSEAASDASFADAVGGFATHALGEDGAYRFADDFSVPPGGWTLTGVTVYAYQPGAAGPVSPFVGLTLRIWSGPPDSPGSTVLFGDDTTNVIAWSQPTNVYRVFNTVALPLPPVPDASRLVWASHASLAGVYLPEGQYYIDWQYACLDPFTPAFSPPVTIPGQRTPGNALQRRPRAGTAEPGWYAVLDAGKPAEAPDQGKDLPFILHGVPGLPCDPDFNQDGNADQDDIACLTQVVAGDPSCSDADPDFNRDGNVDQDDIDALAQVIAGSPCPY